MKKLFYLFAVAAIALAGCDSGGNVPEGPENPEKPGDTQGVLINGVRWATTNVNAPEQFAARPEDLGMFYKWGSNIGWSTADPIVSTNGDTTWDGGSVSGEVWASFYDPCPDGWRVPSAEDFDALCDGSKVVSMWTKQGGVDGRMFVDVATESSIFLPAAGIRTTDGSVYGQGSYGYYWSSTAHITNGYSLNFDSTSVGPSLNGNYTPGFSVRCVRS